MSRPRIEIRMPPRSAFDKFERDTRVRLEAAALNATHIAAGRAKRLIADEMRAAGLGRLGNAIGSGSDLEKRGAVHQSGGSSSASGWVHIRSKSDRTIGAIEAYTQGAQIAPRAGRYLWIPTDNIPARAGRVKITPGNWNKFGLDKRIGPLVMVKSVNGRPLLIAEGATLSASGKTRSAKSRRKDGGLRKGQIERDFVVAFVGIPRTSREARVDVSAIMREVQAMVPGLVREQLRRR